MSRAAQALTRREGRPPKMLAAIVLAVACLLGACDSSTPTPPSSPAGSPAARVEDPAPVAQAAPSSDDPAPSASSAPQPTPTPDPDALRKVAAAQYLAAADAADLKKIQVPADTAADMRDLIRKSAKVEALNVEASGHFARMADFYVVARHLRNAQSRYIDAVGRVRADLGLPPLCPDPPPGRACPAP